MATPGWQLTGYYLIILVLLVVFMKSMSIWAALKTGINRHGTGWQHYLEFLVAPSLALPAWLTRKQADQKIKHRLYTRACLLCALYWLVWRYQIFIPASFPAWLQGYAAIIPFWLMLETCQILMQLIWLPSGYLVPAINNRPYLSTSVIEFWSSGWNRLFGDWLYQVCFKPFSRKSYWGLALAFLVSGLLHELLVSLPYLLVHKKSLFGLMLGYFMFQFLAILAERRLTFPFPLTQRIYSWLVILGPAPMVLNPGTLQIFHLVHSP